MEQAFSVATLGFGLALLATFLAAKLRVSMALMEILVGIAAAAVIAYLFGTSALGSDLPWLKLLASTGAVVLTFLVGVVIGSAVVPTMIANAAFLPRHLLPARKAESGGGGIPMGPEPLPGEPWKEG